MRKLILAGALLLVVGTVGAQELKKGSLVGVHVMTVKLAPGVTIEKFTEFYVKKLIPQVERHRTGWKLYPVKRIRGEQADGFGVMFVIDSEANRDRLYNADGSSSELGKATEAKIQPIRDELKRLGTITADVYTDWLVY